ncbi:concanavalin A-like lectin/glucanase domain-containing protein [Xylariomycetidae sp. FL0641]|nr:concanavalin A-like lectin/glucanase domain-containing protein [Xylariomycetidae sp. FL0641]
MVSFREQRQTLAILVLALCPGIRASFSEVDDDRCDCYLTNASSSNYFTTHKFFDFRSLSRYAKVPNPIEDALDSSEANATSDFFASDGWTEYWGTQSWNNSASVRSGDAPVLMVHSPNNIYIEKNQDESAASDTFMTLRTLRLEDYQSAAEFESQSQDYHFLSIRMYARTVGAPGAVTAMFTYKDSGDPNQLAHVQESDLEIRTIDPPDAVQYTNQPSYSSQGSDKPEATRNATFPGRRSRAEWAVHRMDWTPLNTTWYINGEDVASIKFQTPRDPSMVIFNAWSDGGYWTGNMSVGDEAQLQVQWIELVYNSTGYDKRRDVRGTTELPRRDKKGDEEGCSNVCSIDDTATTGTPVLLHGDAARLLYQMGSYRNVAYWIPATLMALLLW